MPFSCLWTPLPPRPTYLYTTPAATSVSPPASTYRHLPLPYPLTSISRMNASRNTVLTAAIRGSVEHHLGRAALNVTGLVPTGYTDVTRISRGMLLNYVHRSPHIACHSCRTAHFCALSAFFLSPLLPACPAVSPDYAIFIGLSSPSTYSRCRSHLACTWQFCL